MIMMMMIMIIIIIIIIKLDEVICSPVTGLWSGSEGSRGS
jgi:hypothetical protein